MISLPRILVGFGLLALVACGGSSKEADTTPAGEDLAATPVESEAKPEATPDATEVADADAPTDEAAPAGDGDYASVCDQLCSEVLTCAKQMSGKEPTDDEQNQFTQACNAKCVQEDPAQLDQARVCITDHKGDCAGLFPCLEKIESKE